MAALFILMIVLVAFYFIPAFVAYRTKRRNGVAILWCNFFTGWTGVGWVGCLIWALTE